MGSLLRPSVTAVTGLVAGFAVARSTKKRGLGGAVFAALGVWTVSRWVRLLGPARAGALGSLYVAAMGGSHPLAKKIGAWPSVLAVSAAVAGASEVAGRRIARA